MVNIGLLCAVVFATGITNAEYVCKNAETIVSRAEKSGVDPFVLVSWAYQEHQYGNNPDSVHKVVDSGSKIMKENLNVFGGNYRKSLCSFKVSLSKCFHLETKEARSGMKYAVLIMNRAEYLNKVYELFKNALLKASSN